MFVEVQVDLIGWFEEVPFWRKLSSHRRYQYLLPFALRDLYIISYLLEFVKRFWKSFSSFFEDLPEALASVLDATFILYHILSRLSSGFSKFLEILFSKLFLNSAGSLDCFALSLTALILYHIQQRMSTPFSTFFLIHHICFIFLSFMTFECTNATDSDNSRKISQKLFILKCFSAIIYFWKESLWTTHLL